MKCAAGLVSVADMLSHEIIKFKLTRYDSVETRGAAMRRRDFIAGILGSSAAWPLTALAQQQPGRVRLIGALTGIGDDSETKVRYAAFRQELQRLGWIDGQNVRVDVRFGEGDASRIRKQLAELVTLSPDIILTSGGQVTELALQATRTIPIVFTIVPDPVGSGFVESLAEPGGNATGFMQFEYSLSAKWPELLTEIASFQIFCHPRWPDVLWCRLCQPIPTRRWLRGPHFKRRQARRFAGAGAKQV
jgi:ABC transporter substrate binding protein